MDVDAIARLRMRAQRLWGRPGGTPTETLRCLLAVQAQEFPYARWSVAQRTRGAKQSVVDNALDAGTIVRTHVLRPTWHFVAAEDLRWLMRLSGPRVNAMNAGRYRDLGLDARTLGRANEVIADALRGRQLTRRELGDALRAKRISTEGQRLPHILMHAELDSVICSGPRQGKDHTYGLFDERVPRGSVFEGDEAIAELVRRYFTSRGPATIKDLVWWSGLTGKDVRRGLEILSDELQTRVVDDRTYWFAERRVGAARAPRVDLVQCFDETIIAYTQSRDILHTRRVSFAVPRTNEGFTHVLLCDGRLLGHWRRKGDGVETRARRLNATEKTALMKATNRYLASME